MANKQDEAAVAAIEEQETALAVFDENDTRGRDDFDQEDTLVPQIKIAQKTSPEIERGNAKYIKGLEFGNLFNSVTRENYGDGPIPFVVVRRNKNGIQFDKDMKIVDRNVPLDDPRLKWNGDQKPIATLFQNYLILRADTLEPMMLRLKSTQLKVAKQFNTLLKFLKGPIWSGQFELSSTTETFDAGAAGVFVITPAGKPTASVAALAEMLYDQTGDLMAQQVDHIAKEAEGECDPDDDSIPF